MNQNKQADNTAYGVAPGEGVDSRSIQAYADALPKKALEDSEYGHFTQQLNKEISVLAECISVLEDRLSIVLSKDSEESYAGVSGGEEPTRTPFTSVGADVSQHAYMVQQNSKRVRNIITRLGL